MTGKISAMCGSPLRGAQPAFSRFPASSWGSRSFPVTCYNTADGAIMPRPGSEHTGLASGCQRVGDWRRRASRVAELAALGVVEDDPADGRDCQRGAAMGDFFGILAAGPFFFVSAWLLMLFAGIVASDVGIQPFGYVTSMVVTIALWLVLAPAVGGIARAGRPGKK